MNKIEKKNLKIFRIISEYNNTEYQKYAMADSVKEAIEKFEQYYKDDYPISESEITSVEVVYEEEVLI